MKINTDALTAIRERSGMNQAELARRMGVSRTLVNQLESGRRPGTPQVIAKLAKALDVSQLAICGSNEDTAA